MATWHSGEKSCLMDSFSAPGGGGGFCSGGVHAGTVGREGYGVLSNWEEDFRL